MPRNFKGKAIYIPRLFSPEDLLKKRSYFLFGPRQTGKSTLLKKIEGDKLFINLLDPDYYLSLAQNSNRLKEMIRAYPFRKGELKVVIIDEIQKMPQLLDIVHFLLEEDKSLRFILTGSSVRKLRRSGVNLLGGRAGKYIFFPFISEEIKDLIPIEKMMLIGAIPSVVMSDDPFGKLKDYVDVYLKEEIMSEAFVRNLLNFSRFLQTAAFMNGEQLNYEKISNDAQIPARTVKDYFQILEDTLIGILLEPFRPSISRKFVSTPKFYFFDPGIPHCLMGVKNLRPKTIEYGKALEHLIFCELHAYANLARREEEEMKIYYWRTQTQREVDFVISIESNQKRKFVAIEVKASENIVPKYFSGIKALEEEIPLERKIIISTEKIRRITEESFEIYPVKEFLLDLWQGSIC